MQMHACQSADQAIEDARGKRLRNRVKTGILPASDQVIAFIKLCQEVGNLFRVVLQVAIHRENNVTTRSAETSDQGGRLAKVPAEANGPHNTRMLIVQFLHFFKGAIGASIIYEDDFIALSKRIQLS